MESASSVLRRDSCGRPSTPTPVHLTRAYAHLGLGEGSFPIAERAAREILSLPMFPHLRPEQQEYVAERLRLAVGG